MMVTKEINESTIEHKDEQAGANGLSAVGARPCMCTRQADRRVPQRALSGMPGPIDRTTVVSTPAPSSVTRAVPDDKGNKRSTTSEPCLANRILYGKARRIVRFLKVEHGIEPVRKLPRLIPCGSLRKAIRSIYPPDLTLVQELSIKTSMKCEKYMCQPCQDKEGDMLVREWIEKRKEAVDVDEAHLERFAKAFRANIPANWTSKRSPYIPNGHATKDTTTCSGGNWIKGEFSEDFIVLKTISSGKPRVVTLYSEFNTSVLTPLHRSLYSLLSRKGWLLVGPPTARRLRHMSSRATGDWLSYDYIGATDNIKVAYVRRAVEELIQAANDLSEDEVRCLRALSISFDGFEAGSGQPMGSAMSFPLLCLINKAVVDLSLADLLEAGSINTREWSSHPCLINGDDLLTKDTSCGGLNDRIICNGQSVGLKVNCEKTLRHPEYAEINSTLFMNCVLQKKSNVSALWMNRDTEDCLGYAYESSRTVAGFLQIVKNNIARLARSKIKTCSLLPGCLKTACVKTYKIRVALESVPSYAQIDANVFPVVDADPDIRLTREEIHTVITAEVEKVRSKELWLTARRGVADNLERRRKATVNHVPLSTNRVYKLLRPKINQQEKVLKCIALAWERKRKDALLADDLYSPPGCIISDLSGVERLIDAIKAWRQPRSGVRPHTEHLLGDYVSFADVGG